MTVKCRVYWSLQFGGHCQILARQQRNQTILDIHLLHMLSLLHVPLNTIYRRRHHFEWFSRRHTDNLLTQTLLAYPLKISRRGFYCDPKYLHLQKVLTLEYTRNGSMSLVCLRHFRMSFSSTKRNIDFKISIIFLCIFILDFALYPAPNPLKKMNMKSLK